ncbi:hypothetical protein K440DRAFT_642100 [Wilcoxina mikolae CBS 423.85]|nr:hypothetical protein K440DRAFT_642100 [Wilcoxina mikolae CBS 423.85]
MGYGCWSIDSSHRGIRMEVLEREEKGRERQLSQVHDGTPGEHSVNIHPLLPPEPVISEASRNHTALMPACPLATNGHIHYHYHAATADDQNSNSGSRPFFPPPVFLSPSQSAQPMPTTPPLRSESFRISLNTPHHDDQSHFAYRSISYLTYIIVAMLPVLRKIHNAADAQLRREAQAALFQLTCHVFKPLLKVDPDMLSIRMNCGDGLIRDRYPILARYIADHSEQTKNLHALKNNCCPKCEVPATATGEMLSPTELARLRFRPEIYMAKYRELWGAEDADTTKEIEDWVETRHAHPRRNLFWNMQNERL